MADALCGPSNSLQVLQKHVSAEKTFQQEQLLTNRSPLEGFRSSQGPIFVDLDAEFEAFQALQPSGNEAFGRDFLNSDAATNSVARNSNDPRLSDWALDFQALQINEYRTPPILSSQFREIAPLQLKFQRGGQPEFSRWKFQALTPHQSQQKRQIGEIFGRPNQTSYNRSNQPYAIFNPFPIGALQKAENSYQATDSLDDDAFQRAFDAAEQSAIDSTRYWQQESSARTQNVLMRSNPEKSAQGLESPSSRLNQESIYEPLESTSVSQHEIHDADGLARTAGELLDKVKHESNPKFQNSNFLSLMRQLRDREVHVEGDKIVDTTHPLHPGGKFYPHTSVQNNQEDVESLSYSDTTMTGAIHNDRAEA